MRKRVIVVPKDKETEVALDFDEATKEQLIELHLNENEFSFLYHKGIFELINNEGCSNIDDFEDDSIKGVKSLEKVLASLKMAETSLSDQNQLFKSLINLFEEAIERDTGVYFYF